MSIEQAEKSLAPSHGQALSAGMQEFRLNLELLPEAAMIYAIDGTILSVNSITARIFEADASEIIGKNLFSMGALKAEEARAALARLMRGEAIRFQVDFTSLKCHQHRLEVLHVPMFTAIGEVERVLGFAPRYHRGQAYRGRTGVTRGHRGVFRRRHRQPLDGSDHP